MQLKKKKKKISVKHRLQRWCKLVVDFPSLNDWAEDRGWGVINPRLVMTRQAKKRCSGGWARTPLLWLVLGCGTNFQRPRQFLPSTPSHWSVSTRKCGSNFFFFFLLWTCQTDQELIFNQRSRAAFSKPRGAVFFGEGGNRLVTDTALYPSYAR